MRPPALSLRLRLSLVFAAVMAIVLTATGVVVYRQLETSLDSSIDRSLTARAADIAALVRQSDNGLGQTRLGDGQTVVLAQVLDARGRVFDSSPQLRRTPLLSPDQFRRAQRDTLIFDPRPLPGVSGPVRLIALPVQAQGQRLVVVAGASLASRNAALATLRTLLLVGGPLVLVVSAIACYLVAAAALRSVEAIRSQAALISAHHEGRRLPVHGTDEIGRLGATLNEMLGRLESASRRERDFLADASHELRTPLALLKGELDLARRHVRTRDELDRVIATAAEETDRLVRLSESLLVLARADQDGLALHRRQVVVEELLERVARRFRPSGRSIAVDCPPQLTLVADADRLDQAMTNLVDNALRHGQGRVAVEAVAADGTIELHVTDQGPGFPADFLPRAFDRFARSDGSRHGGGSGLGLSIVQAIADAHSGSAGASNTADGTDVWIALPRAPGGGVG